MNDVDAQVGVVVAIPRLLACVAVGSITLGGLLYLAFRTTALRLFAWVGALGLTEQISAMRRAVAGMRASIPDVVIYSLPNALWTLSMTASLRLVLRHGSRRERLLWTLVPLAAAVVPEAAQAVHLVAGTFDWLDLALGIVGWVVGMRIRSTNGRAEE